MVGRYCPEDGPPFQLSDGVVPPGCGININQLGFGRDPEVWGDDVLDFRPERWGEPRTQGLPNVAFSLGLS